MYWLFLFLAIALELIGTSLMKISNGLTRLIPSVGMFIAYFLCFSIFSLALKKIEVSIAYAIWSGVGITVISILGVAFFKESINMTKVISIILIITGIIGLNLSGVSR
ncbi:MAG: multidrug efflux SMR transporter [Clostridium sp.]|uniref:DMT family transporter n=1 Tax=Clostridium sp. TaxID=1506 RepID=UPI0025B8A1BF|nr:multidrug efflux SMR transporter [Clostridium sp.]MCH3963735.1 multidrug efflux SMR transporter [Clostridium sp.]MCI1714876.1 multidrug efflux SMR transporter [Clostridium sp.]MCI1798935.1 multidrug efflux SMR transporter [Clostridium sp.]MCI1813059.1 multidrug efflux SMR transporter [Clostridium sp.]MCI1869949.1 multidrug efflux SMR transporter [Clostridium sp.]